MDRINKIKVHRLGKSYNGIKVLRDISFNIEKGEFVSILGPSGCGKTTILRLLIGLEQVTEGTIYKDGKCINQLEPDQRGMGIVFQNYALFPNMSVLENVMYPLRIKKDFKKHAKNIAIKILEKVDLLEHIDKMPNELSGGQKQRVAIARTLVLQPDVILLDEALAALDITNRKIMAQEFKKIQAEFGVTMIYITHDQEEAFSISDKIIVMSEGKIEQIGSPEDILRFPANHYIKGFINDHLMEKIDSLNKILEKQYA